MGFFDIGAGEVLLILVVVLLVFGPGKLPEIARSIGKGIYEFKRYSGALTRDLKEEMEKGQPGWPAAVTGTGKAQDGETVGAVVTSGPSHDGAFPEKQRSSE